MMAKPLLMGIDEINKIHLFRYRSLIRLNLKCRFCSAPYSKNRISNILAN